MALICFTTGGLPRFGKPGDEAQQSRTLMLCGAIFLQQTPYSEETGRSQVWFLWCQSVCAHAALSRANCQIDSPMLFVVCNDVGRLQPLMTLQLRELV